jgi:hypothetical protein
MSTRVFAKFAYWWIIPLVVLIAILTITLGVLPQLQKTSYSSTGEILAEVLKPKTSHISTPDSVRAIYMTSWVAATPSLRANLLQIIDETEINAVVIDIKDYTGKISFAVRDPELQKIGSAENRIKDIDAFIESLHDRGVYVIGRLSAFQDAYMTEHRPDLAVKRESDGKVWRDRKGISWIDASAPDMWEYLVRIAEESHARGFDEINFDYIRFPSDGNMQDIAYPFTKTNKPQALENFFAYVAKEFEDSDIVLSADLFGMVTSNTDDLGIGQVLERALPYFDYIAPMVYPSHYPTGWHGFKNPAAHPYEVIKISMSDGIKRAEAMGVSPLKLRPWIQDFNLGADYTAEMVRAQIKATYDIGLTSWMIWDPANTYTRAALLND